MGDMKQAHVFRPFNRVRVRGSLDVFIIADKAGADPVRCFRADTAHRREEPSFFPVEQLELVAEGGDQPCARNAAFSALKAKYRHLIPADFAFECGVGWIGILDRYFAEVDAILPSGASYRLHGVRCRGATLAVDACTGDGTPEDVSSEVQRASMRADGRSNHWCETCGKPGRPRQGDWISAACDTHSAGYEPKDPEVAVFADAGVRYLFDHSVDDVIPLTSELAAVIPGFPANCLPESPEMPELKRL